MQGQKQVTNAKQQVTNAKKQVTNAKICWHHMQGQCRFGKICKNNHSFLKLYMIRHAESSYNEMLEIFSDAFSEPAKTKFQMNQAFLDCGITDKGIKQINSMKFPELLGRKIIKVDLILVSPLNRCLKTAERCLHKYKIQTKKIIVLPHLTEVLSKIGDFSSSIQTKKTRFPDFDFTYMTNDCKEDWQDELVDPQYRPMIQLDEQYGKRYMNILKNIFPEPLESSQRCFQRTLGLIDEIKEICKKEQAQLVLVFSHNRIIKYIMGRDRQGKAKSIQNCEIKFTALPY